MCRKTARKGFLLILFFWVMSDSAFASITDVKPTDKSLEYLRYIFGDIVNVITGGNGPENPDSILGALSEILNTGMLIFTGLIVGYVFITGVLNSANEGNPLGKAYNTMWIPLRMVLALGLVLPFAGGYSTMQIGVIWLAGHGIGLANTSWDRALDYMSATGTLYPPTINTNYEAIAQGILESRVCMHGINNADRRDNIVENPVELVNNQQNSNIATSAQTQSTPPQAKHRVQQRFDSYYSGVITAKAAYGLAWLDDFEDGKPQYYGENPCGSITLEFNEIDEGVAIENEVIDFQQKIIAATADLDVALNSLAVAIVIKATDDTAPEPDVTKLNTEVQNYKTKYEKAVNDALSAIATKRINKWDGGDPDVSGSSVGARDAGWVSVGAWYWDLQRINAETQRMVSVKPEVDGPTSRATKHEDYGKYVAAFERYTQNMMVKDEYGNTVTAMERSSYSEDNYFLDIVLDGVQGAMDIALTNPDPVSGMANIGHTIIDIIEFGYLSSLTVYIPTKTGLDASKTLGGVPGSISAAVLSTASSLIKEVRGLIIVAAMLLIPLALMLAFYLPATPLILWIMGVAGWFVLLIEAVIAAPIWAASHAMPEGNGFVGQRAMAGYMVMISLFLRPTLMIIGFFASMVLMIVMGKVVSLLFIPYMSSMNAEYLSGIATLFGMLAVFTLLIVQIAHRAYGLIHEVPDKVLRYIGGGAENLGESNNEQQGRSIFVGGAAKIADGNQRYRPRGGGASPQGDTPQGGGGTSLGGAAASGAGKLAKSGMSKFSKMLSPKA